MQIKQTIVKWLAGAALVVTAAGALSGCYIEGRGRHYRPVIFVR